MDIQIDPFNAFSPIQKEPLFSKANVKDEKKIQIIKVKKIFFIFMTVLLLSACIGSNAKLI